MVNYQELSNKLLKDHKLRITDQRNEVLEIFLRQKKSLNHHDLETLLGKKIDRVTLYRTLLSFVEGGILHKVPDKTGAIQYALCDDCTHHEHNDEHIHFKCLRCENITCLDSVHLPAIELPTGYSFVSGDMIITGICKNCNAGLA